MILTGIRRAPLALVVLVATAHAAATPVGEAAFSGADPVRDFEEFASNAVVSSQFAGVGVTFSSTAGGWDVEPYSSYGPDLESEALALGLGDQGLIHQNQSEAIAFEPPVSRVGFRFGSNLDVHVAVTLRRGELAIGTFDLIVSMDQMPFFGFEDLDGIDRVEFATEQNNEFVSQLDHLRFEREPTGSVLLIGPDDFSGEEAVLGFEALSSGTIVTDQFQEQGVRFDSAGLDWGVLSHSEYNPTFTSAALAQGAGQRGLRHRNEGEAILFDPPVERVAFQFGSNVDVRVPVVLRRGGLEIGSTELLVLAYELPFFGFQDAGGIDRLEFGTEQNDEFVSQLDNLRVEVPEPGAPGLGAAAALAVLAWRRSGGASR